jgi:hypothetical protein
MMPLSLQGQCGEGAKHPRAHHRHIGPSAAQSRGHPPCHGRRGQRGRRGGEEIATQDHVLGCPVAETRVSLCGLAFGNAPKNEGNLLAPEGSFNRPMQRNPPPVSTKPKLIIRKAKLKDSHAIAALSERVYGHAGSMTEEQVRAQINKFPEGQMVAEYEGEIAGHCATFIISRRVALKPHSWFEITGNGYASRHDPDGDVLYGMEVCVDARFRRLRIGQRFIACAANYASISS